MKPLGAVFGMTGEMKDLAMVISKVRADLPVSSREVLVIFVIWECCLFLFTVPVNANS